MLILVVVGENCLWLFEKLVHRKRAEKTLQIGSPPGDVLGFSVHFVALKFSLF
jgi:hypothetical protein